MSPETKKKILVIDDEEALVEALSARLESAGYAVLSAYTGEKGLQLARTELPDAIILDIYLPGEDGLAIIKQLKRPIDPQTGDPSKTRKIPVIVLTGKAEKMEDMFQMEECFAFFTKPFDSKELLASVAKAAGA